MTTIAYDGTTVAADGRATAEGLLVSDKTKKLITIKKAFFNDEEVVCLAFAGAMEDAAMLINHLKTESLGLGSRLELECHGLLFTKYGIYLFEGSNFAQQQDEPIAMGSGAIAALTAMRLGLDAKAAVKTAMKMDVYTGGRITAIQVRNKRVTATDVKVVEASRVVCERYAEALKNLGDR